MPAPIQSCAICHQPLAGSATVPTTVGDAVHIGCADREALVAARSRTVAALVSGALLVAVGGWGLAVEGWTLGAGDWEVIATLALLIALHVQFNRRWWQELVWWVLGIRGRRPAGFPQVVSLRFIQPNDSAETRRKPTSLHESGRGDTRPAEDTPC